MEQLKKDGVKNPPMPPNPMPHIIDRLVEIGLSEAAGMGASPISWGEIAAWQQNTWVTLAPWEARLIKRLSTDYLAMTRKAEDETCPPPWRAPVTVQQRDTEVDRLRMVLG